MLSAARRCRPLRGGLMTRTVVVASGSSVRGKHTLPDLPYDFAALQPTISAEIMQLHYQKHHAGYVANYNAAEEKFEEARARNDLAAMIGLHSALRFNGGGHVNHSLFWTILAPEKDCPPAPSGDLLNAINKQWGSLDKFVATFNATTGAIQGSGWGWLGYNPANGSLQISTTPNQDPLSTLGLTPLLGVDVWEHAYYLQYKNVRPDYLKAIWKVINWNKVAERYAAAAQKK